MGSKDEVYTFTLKNDVVNVGLRLNIAKYLPDELELRVDNVINNNASINEVRIYLKGRKESIQRFYDFLKTKKLGHAKDYSFSELQPLKDKGCFDVNTDRFLHKLQCEQMEKFVDVGLGMQKDMTTMSSNMGGMKDGIGGMRGDIQNMSKNIEELVSVLKKNKE